jgi:hypothetical protein
LRIATVDSAESSLFPCTFFLICRFSDSYLTFS